MAVTVSVTKQVNRRKTSHLVLAFFLLAMMVDYGGGFGIKSLVGVLALGWVLLHKSSFPILVRRRADFVVLLGIPILLATFHLLRLALTDSLGDLGPVYYATRFYNTISSSSLIILFPLFYFAGHRTAARQMRIAFRLLAVILLLVFALQVVGFVNLSNYTELAETYRIGFIGIDPRLPDAASNQQGQLAPRIAFAIPLVLGYELPVSPIAACLLLLSLLVVGSRGLILGAASLFILWFFLQMNRRPSRVLLMRLAVFAVLALIVVAISEPIRFRVTGVFLARTQSMAAGSDFTTQVRLGHLQGYRDLVESSPWKLFLGAGPTGYITNPYLQDSFGSSQVDTTESPLLNLAIYYGVPYAMLYGFWLFRSAWRLWKLRKRPAFRKTDLGLVLGATVFWITGNFNPQMTAPFAIIAYMLLTVRRDELLLQERR